MNILGQNILLQVSDHFLSRMKFESKIAPQREENKLYDKEYFLKALEKMANPTGNGH